MGPRGALGGEEDGLVRDPTAADYTLAAEYGLEAGDLALARTQIAAALTFDPLDKTRLALADRIVVASGAASRRAGSSFFGDLALRARALTRTGDYREALELLLHAVCFRPSASYLVWTEDWPEQVLRSAHSRDDALIAGLARFVGVVDEATVSPRNIVAARRLCTILASPNGPVDRATRAVVLGSMLSRRSGHPDEGRALLRAVHERKADTRTAAELGRVAVAERAFDEAARWFGEAERLDPADGAIVLDRADAELAAGRLADAAASYRRARAIIASPWADVSLAYVEARLDHDRPGCLARLVSAAGDRALDSEIRGRAARFLADVRAFSDELPLPHDPLTSLCFDHLRQIASGPAPLDGPVVPIVLRVQADRPAPPSLRLAFARGCEAFGRVGSLEVVIGGEAASATDACAFLDGRPLPRSSRPLPSADDQTRALSFVVPGGDLATLRERVVSELPPDPEALLRVALSPPVPPRDRHPLRFVLALHAAAAIGLAEHARRGTVGSFATLCGLARDGDTWLSAAALTALAPFLASSFAELAPLFHERAASADSFIARAARRALLAEASGLSPDERRALLSAEIVNLFYELRSRPWRSRRT